MNDELGIAIAVVVGIACVLGCASLWWAHTRGSPGLRNRRARAALRVAITPGEPFELAGVVQGDLAAVVLLDLDVHVLGGCDVEVDFRGCGVRLELEIDGARTERKLPDDRTKLGPDVRAVDTILPSQRTRVSCTVPVDGVSVAPGRPVQIRGLLTPLPHNEVHAAALWLA